MVVPPLTARRDAEPGLVQLAWHATVEDEAHAVADEIETAWRAGRSAAVLCRVRSQFPMLEAALRGRGLPVEVVGLGGLLHVPEVADLRAALEVVHDASRGDSLMRLLTGAAHRIGPRDLDALGAWALQMWRRAPEPDPSARAVADPAEDLSLVEALDALPPQEWTGPAGQLISGAGRARLSRLAALLRHLRRRTGLALPELVLETERALLLDIEVSAVPGHPPAAARANLDAFVDVAAAFAERAGGGGATRESAGGAAGLGAFLAWLDAAESEERGLDAPLTQVRDDAVQLLTVHAAKGLEWDVVAVPGLAEGTFPNGRSGRSPGPSSAWLTDPAALPYPIRGDRAGLPTWQIEKAATQRELKQALELFKEDCGEYLLTEERRLAYVALTRARQSLVLSGAVWADGVRPRTPSRFLTEIAELAGRTGPIRTGVWHEVGREEANPREEVRRALDWPADPLGDRRAAVEAAAAAVREAMASGDTDPDAPDPAEDSWQAEATALLAERDAGRRDSRAVRLPGHLSASRMVALARDPADLALRLRRPMPRRPSPQARRGSAFHVWLEQRFASAALVDVDELPGSADEPLEQDEDHLALWQANFLASPWAQRTPFAVEVAVETPIAMGGGRAPVMLRGRIDAVFRGEPPTDPIAVQEPLWEVVDWKTGRPPVNQAEQAAAGVQLAIYRLAWADLVRVAPERVSAAFFYASVGATHRPVDLLGGDRLTDLVTGAVSSEGPE